MKKIILVSLFFLLFSPSLVFALVNINTAGLDELDSGITGVGPAIAGKIILYRETNGLFKTIEEIKNVSGIGDATFLKMKDQITVSADSSTGGGEGNPGETATGSPDTDFSEGEPSAHTGETAISDYQKEALKISAGRERLATVRTPIVFAVSQNKKGQSTNSFIWSFGDGTSASGQKVYHSYQFPGRYNVVLNGAIDKEEEAVARTIVVVVDPKIKVTAIDLDSGFVEIKNDSDKEQNLNGWIIKSEIQKYVFPVDTIVSPKSSIKIPIGVIGFSDKNIKEISLSYPDGGVVSGGSLSEGVDLQKVAELRKQIAKLKQQMINNSPEISFRGAATNVQGQVTSGEGKSVVILKQEPNWFEKIKNAIFK
ncbi:MAG: helix-hairpin-helix domain-containing protein [Candidatus Paceibacterota bacterium]|jgi:competence ComEA-like helix-hairpin-helix protein